MATPSVQDVQHPLGQQHIRAQVVRPALSRILPVCLVRRRAVVRTGGRLWFESLRNDRRCSWKILITRRSPGAADSAARPAGEEFMERSHASVFTWVLRRFHQTPRRLLVILGLLGLGAGSVRAIGPLAADGGSVHGSVFAPVSGNQLAPFENGSPISVTAHIPLPAFEVRLLAEGSGSVVASATTDVFGRYHFLDQRTGAYRVCWVGAGWVAACAPQKISIKNNITHVVAAAVRAEILRLPDGSTRGAFWGRVKLADGSSPFFSERYFALERTADVTVTDLSGKLLYKTISNVAGEFVAVGVPAVTLRARAKLDGPSAAVLVSATTVRTGSGVAITLPNSRPRLLSLAAEVGGKGVREAARASQLELVAEARDADNHPLSFDWRAAPASGKVSAISGVRASWQLEDAVGLQTAYLLLSDGNGGYATQAVSVRVSDGTVSISGKVLTQLGAPIGKARVQVNGKPFTAQSSGAFTVGVPRSERYVVTASSPGFMPASRVFDQSGVYSEYRLVKATVVVIDPSKDAEIIDRPTEGRPKEFRPAAVRLKANSLVGPDGQLATVPVLARIATVNVEGGEMPGDFGAASGGREANLISYGAVFAEFEDAAGTRYNLAPGTLAELLVPPPPALLAPPPTIALWSFNEKTGLWDDLERSAIYDPNRKLYVGHTPHFSVINTDLAKADASCVRVLLDNVNRNQLSARITYVSGGTPFAQTFEGALGDALNVVRRLPENTNIKIAVIDSATNLEVVTAKLLDADQQVLPGNVLNTGPATTPIFADTPYENCVTVSVRLDLPVGSISRIPFLAFKGEGSKDQAVGYYQVLDPAMTFDESDPLDPTWSGGNHSTLGDWWGQAGFDPGTGAGGVRATYLNHNDLGFGRDMHVRKSVTGDVFAYVTNYGKADQNPSNANDADVQNLATQGATVAMEFTPQAGVPGKVVKFFVYSNGQAAGKLINSANLDGFGEKFVPNLCTTCHGGEFYAPINPALPTALEVSLRPSLAAAVGTSFREFDTESLRYPGGIDVLPVAQRQTFFDLNQLVKDTAPQPEIVDLINGWYAGIAPTDPPNDTFTPAAWIDAGQPTKQQLYQQVVGKSCRTCHVAFGGGSSPFALNWSRYDQFQNHRGIIQSFVCGDDKFMPHALMTYRNFWLEGGPHSPTVLGSFAVPGWASFGGCQ
jgi:hypothetical protein